MDNKVKVLEDVKDKIALLFQVDYTNYIAFQKSLQETVGEVVKEKYGNIAAEKFQHVLFHYDLFFNHLRGVMIEIGMKEAISENIYYLLLRYLEYVQNDFSLAEEGPDEEDWAIFQYASIEDWIVLISGIHKLILGEIHSYIMTYSEFLTSVLQMKYKRHCNRGNDMHAR